MLKFALPIHRHTSNGSPLTICTSVLTRDSFSLMNCTALAHVFSLPSNNRIIYKSNNDFTDVFTYFFDWLQAKSYP